MVGLSFFGKCFFLGYFQIWHYVVSSTCYTLFALNSFELLPSNCFKCYVGLEIFCFFLKCFCSTATKMLIARILIPKLQRIFLLFTGRDVQLGRCFFTRCPNFSTKSQNDLIYHNAKKPSAPTLDVTFKCKLGNQEILRFYALPQHKNTEHGFSCK